MNHRYLLRLAWRSSWGSPTKTRFKPLLATIVIGLVSFVSGGVASAWQMSNRINDRVEARNFRPVAEGVAPSYERAVQFDQLPSGRSVLVVWWRIRPGAPSLPGLSPNTRPGWFLSPGLMAEIANDPTLAYRFPEADTLRDAGVGRADELVAYRLVDDEVATLPEQLSAARYEYLGDRADLEWFPVVLATVLSIILPGLLAVIAVFAVTWSEKSQRNRALVTLGVSEAGILRLALADGIVMALPGACVGAFSWYLIAPHLRTVPLVGTPVLPFDLSLPWYLSVGTIVGTVVLAVIASFLLQRPRPRKTVSSFSRPIWKPYLFLIGLGLVVGAVLASSGALRPRLFIGGVLVTTVGLIRNLPTLLHDLGMAMVRFRSSTVALLGGRSLAMHATVTAKSLGAVVLLGALIPLAMAWVAVARQQDEPTEQNRMLSVYGLASDAALEVGEYYQSPVVLLEREPRDDGALHGYGACRDIHVIEPSASCLDGVVSGLRPGPPIVLDLSRPPDHPEAIFPSRTGSNLEAEIRSLAVNAASPDWRVSSGNYPQESSLVPWILGAAQITSVFVSVALLAALIGRAHVTAIGRSRLGAVGASRLLVQRVSAEEAALSVAAAAATGLMLGVILATGFSVIEPTAMMPWSIVGLGVMVAAVASFIAALVAWATTLDPALVWTDRNHTGW